MTQSQTSSRRAPHTWQPMRLTPQVWPQIRKRGVSLVVGGRGLLSSRHTHLSTSERVNTARCLTSLNSLKVPAVMVTGWLVTGLKGSLHTFMMFYWYFSKFSYIFFYVPIMVNPPVCTPISKLLQNILMLWLFCYPRVYIYSLKKGRKNCKTHYFCILV